MPPSADVRPFERRDREQLTALVNAHVDVVVPGVAVSVNAVLSRLEREPGEMIVDPWAIERATYVAVVRDAVAGAAHLVRYGADARVSDSYRDAAEIRWLVFAPGDEAAADALAARCVATMRDWGVARMYADGSLPAPGVFGVPDVWPQVAGPLERAGFVPGDRVESVLVADVADLPRAAAPPVAGARVQRTLGRHATRFSALLSGRVVGIFEVQGDLTGGGALSRLAGWADVWELHVEEDMRRRGIARGSSATARSGCASGGSIGCSTTRSSARTTATSPSAAALGFRELTRTRRPWERPAPAP